MNKVGFFLTCLFIVKINPKSNNLKSLIMKQFKALLVIILAVFIFSSCKDESVKVPDQTVSSIAAKSSMAALKTHFNPDGSLSRDGENPTNNLIFDFCFDFVYPVTLSYNTGAEVTVENFEGLVTVLINMNDNLYIDGIAFPFQVEIFNSDSNTFETLTIQNEDAFMSLLDTCSIDDSGNENDNCNCTEQYDPVCVTVRDTSNDSYTIEFPNMCLAECEGFTQNDVVDCNYDNPSNIDLADGCFNFIYPFSVTNTNGETVEINNDNDFENITYSNYFFDLVYPVTIETEVNGENQTITLNNAQDLTDILMLCDGNQEDCNCTTDYNPVCVENPANGEILTFNNACLAACEGFTSDDFVSCNSGNQCWDFVFPIQIIVDNNSVFTVNSDSDFNDLYNPTNTILVYPFSVEINGEREEIETPNDFASIGGLESRCN